MSGGGTANSTTTKLVKPGYHLRPKYDLHGLRHRRTGGGKGHIAGELPLTSMIDMFSILVIYLLMNFSATGEMFFVNKNLTLPKGASTHPLENGPLLSVVGDHFVLDAPPAIKAGVKGLEDSSMGLDTIVGTLKEIKATMEASKMEGSQRINIQADEEAPIGAVKRAMTAAVNGGWTDINFVVDKKTTK